MYCYDLKGDFIWKRDLGPAKTRLSFGEASSPVIHDDRLIITRDHEDQSSIFVLNAQTGDTIWQKERDEPSCWATPIVVKHKGRNQLITNGHNRVRSYDLENGELLWECGGQVSNVTPSPVADATTVYCMSGYRGSSAMALPLDATGDITDSDEVLWIKSKGTPYVPSPLLYDGLLYFNRTNDNILTCLDAKTGEAVIDQTRAKALNRVYASPVGAAGRIYFVGRRGVTLVLKKGAEFEILATNELDEPIDASPALVGSEILLRSEKSLYCISESN